MNTITINNVPPRLAGQYSTFDVFLQTYQDFAGQSYTEFGELSQHEITPRLQAQIDEARKIPRSEYVNL